MGGFLSSPVVRIPLAASSFGTSEALYNKPGQYGFTERSKFASTTSDATGGTLASTTPKQDAQQQQETARASQALSDSTAAADALASERARVIALPQNVRSRATSAEGALGSNRGKRPSASSYLSGASS